MTDYRQMTIEAFTDITASDAPAPGGGGVAAYAGALAVALSEMVANLTVGKKGYEDLEEEMKRLAAEGEALRRELLAGVAKDAESFNGYMAALAMPKDTEEQKEIRRAKMQEGLKEASRVPLETAKTVCKIFPLAERVVESGNKNAVTDGLVSAMLARSAVLGALLNVKINLGSIRDEAFVAAFLAETEALEREAVEGERRILALSELTGDLVRDRL